MIETEKGAQGPGGRPIDRAFRYFALHLRYFRSSCFVLLGSVITLALWSLVHDFAVRGSWESTTWRVVDALLQVWVAGLAAHHLGMLLLPLQRRVSWRRKRLCRQNAFFDRKLRPNLQKECLLRIIKASQGPEVTARIEKEIDELIGQRGTTNEELKLIQWYSVSKLLKKMERWSRFSKTTVFGETSLTKDENEVKSVDSDKILDLHRHVQHTMLLHVLSVFPVLTSIIAFIVIFANLNDLLSLIVGTDTKDWRNLVLWIAIIPLLTLTISHPIQWLLRAVTETTDSEFDDLLVSFLLIPAIAGAVLFCIANAGPHISSFLSSFSSDWCQDEIVDTISDIIRVGVVLWISIFLWRYIVVKSLRRLARATKQKHDDVFVEILNAAGFFLLTATALGVIASMLLVHYIDIKPKDVLFPFTVLLSVITVILSHSARETIENFFAGILLQIDKPFDLGERLVLSGGEICDVRAFGMRSTTLYNVLQNTELSIPNKVLSGMIITNISRPDSHLRIQVHAHVAQHRPKDCEGSEFPAGMTTIEAAQACLLKIAYRDEEINTILIRRPEDGSDSEAFVEGPAGRVYEKPSLMDLLYRLKNRHPGKVSDYIDSALLSEDTGAIPRFEARQRSILDRMRPGASEEIALKDFVDLASEFGMVSRSVYKLKESSSALRTEMDGLLNELAHEPVVFSEFEVSEDGVPYVRLTLNCFATYLERRYEVAHRLLIEIQKKFDRHAIPYLSFGIDYSTEVAGTVDNVSPSDALEARDRA